MLALKFIGIGAFVLLSVPAAVAASDGRRTLTVFHVLLGLGGVVWNWSRGGPHAALLSLVSGVLVLTILALLTAFMRVRFSKRILLGGEMKLMTAASTWLLPLAALLALALASAAIILWLVAKIITRDRKARPELCHVILASALFVLIAI